jgi:predicted 3-demethylubiquinone-9 3-methyltransferase (glyoxalase superfamily)
MGKITPFLWFDTQAEEAAKFYVSIFKKSRIRAVTRYTEAGPQPAESVMTVEFQLAGHDFVALNGGPQFKFTEAISFWVSCKDQKEVDYFWSRLTAGGGTEVQCGWLKDKYGLFWQIVPTALIRMLKDKNTTRLKRVMQAMFPMKKLDIKKLQEAYDAGSEPAKKTNRKSKRKNS